MAGKSVTVETTRVFGCSAKWADKRQTAALAVKKWDSEPVTLETIDVEGIKNLAKNEIESESNSAKTTQQGVASARVRPRSSERRKKFEPRQAATREPVGHVVRAVRAGDAGVGDDEPNVSPAAFRVCDNQAWMSPTPRTRCSKHSKRLMRRERIFCSRAPTKINWPKHRSKMAWPAAIYAADCAGRGNCLSA